MKHSQPLYPNQEYASSISINPEFITNDWLTDTLRRGDTIGPETSLISVDWKQIAADVGFTSSLYRFAVQYSQTVDVPTTFVGKFTDGSSVPEALQHLVKREVCFNLQVNDPGVIIPCCHFTTIDNKNYVLSLLEDLGSENWPDQMISATPQQSTIVMKALAKMYASSADASRTHQ
ncbi:MAG TPA: hypothetical protein QF517_02685 [Pseudomonadales bacterium]|nr:hypothetical protein [Gammaproteobacteria bacterium]MDP6026180.1 hypothetical protein [Pseudomonadales bacterium]MDP7451203.1 hypothetical protein [Arenicellales bacterium]MDP6314955.1 hypothetical protein [Pseudomonadales bacterium]MDP7314833.1 hypothetical protein [Pseudomonadales bacterium]